MDINRVQKSPEKLLLPYPADNVRNALNHFIPNSFQPYLRVLSVKPVPSTFHARFSAQQRVYVYRIIHRSDPPLSSFASQPTSQGDFRNKGKSRDMRTFLWESQRAWCINNTLDCQLIQEAAQYFVGCHDLTAFSSLSEQVQSIRTIDAVKVSQYPLSTFFSTYGPYSQDLQCMDIIVKSRSFLYHQVRLMVGTLVAVGLGKKSPSDIQRLLLAKSRAQPLEMAPACGLYLSEVVYNPLDEVTDTENLIQSIIVKQCPTKPLGL